LQTKKAQPFVLLNGHWDALLRDKENLLTTPSLKKVKDNKITVNTKDSTPADEPRVHDSSRIQRCDDCLASSSRTLPAAGIIRSKYGEVGLLTT
jgi:hypothetical protein